MIMIIIIIIESTWSYITPLSCSW